MLLGGSPGYAKQKSPCVIRLINFWLYRYIYWELLSGTHFGGNEIIQVYGHFEEFPDLVMHCLNCSSVGTIMTPVFPFTQISFVSRLILQGFHRANYGLKLAKCLISKVLFSTLLCSNNMIREAYRFNMRCQKKLVGCFPHQKKKVGRLWWAFTTGSLSDPELLREMLNQQRRRSKNSTREWLNPF